MKVAKKKFIVIPKQNLKPSVKTRKTARRFVGYSGR